LTQPATFFFSADVAEGFDGITCVEPPLAVDEFARELLGMGVGVGLGAAACNLNLSVGDEYVKPAIERLIQPSLDWIEEVETLRTTPSSITETVATRGESESP
jgi:hypothetical protein